MELTHGNPENLSEETVTSIRDRIGEEGYEAGLAQGLKDAAEQHTLEEASRRNSACKQAENEVNKVYRKKQQLWLGMIKTLQVLISIVILVVTVSQIATAYKESSSWAWPIFAGIALIISAIQTVSSLMNQDNWLNRRIKKALEERRRKTVDKRKEKCLAILDGRSES